MAEPHERVINKIVPLASDSVAYWLGERYNRSGQAFSPHEGSHDGRWRNNKFVVRTEDGGMFYAQAPNYGRSGPKYRSGRIINVLDTIKGPTPVVTRIARLPRAVIQKPWSPLPTEAPIHEVIVQRYGAVDVFPFDRALDDYVVDEEVQQLSKDPSLELVDSILERTVGKTAWVLAISTMPK